MIFIAREEQFTCGNCKFKVEPLKKGSYRNHCPRCLFSKHVDDKGPGDRESLCQGLMEPISLDYRGDKGWMIIHLCVKCKKQIPNITAPDDDLSVMSE